MDARTYATIKRLAPTIRNLPYEVGYVLGPRGRVHYRKTQRQEECVTWEGDERIGLKGKYMLHNHPDNQGLSNMDLNFLLGNPIRGIIAVGRDRTYILENPEWETTKWLAMNWYEPRRYALVQAHESVWLPIYSRMWEQGADTGYQVSSTRAIIRLDRHAPDIAHEAILAAQLQPEWGNLRYEMRYE